MSSCNGDEPSRAWCERFVDLSSPRHLQGHVGTTTMPLDLGGLALHNFETVNEFFIEFHIFPINKSILKNTTNV